MTYDELQQLWSAGKKADAARGLERLLDSPDGTLEPALRYNCAWTLACMHYYGDGVPRDDARARDLHARARAIEEASESYFDSDTPWSGPTRTQLRQEIARAEGGDVEARFRAGMLCLEGCSPEGYFICDEELVLDIGEATRHFHLAALRGHAAALERFMHIQRGAIIGLQTVNKWGEEMLAAFYLLESLAEAGNARCRGLVDTICLGDHDPRIGERAKARLEAMAREGSSAAMRAFARQAWNAAAPDPAAALGWLQRAGHAGDSDAVAIASALTAATEVLGELRPREKSAIAGMLGPRLRDPFEDLLDERRPAPPVGDRILGIAYDRVARDDPKRRSILSAAAQHGSALAAALLLKAEFDEAPDKGAFLHAWLRGDDPVPPIPTSPAYSELSGFGETIAQACFSLAIEMDERNPPDLAESALWYWRGLLADWRSGQPPALTAHDARSLKGGFCYYVARRLDPRVYNVNKDPARAVRWYVRGLERGDVTCLGVWFNLCFTGALGLSPDPVVALQMAERWRAAGTSSKPVGCCNEIRAYAEKLADRAAAAAWLSVVERLGS